MSSNEQIARELAEEVVQSIADSMPDDDTTEAQEILRGTDYESMFVLHGEVIQRYVEIAISNALADGVLRPR